MAATPGTTVKRETEQSVGRHPTVQSHTMDYQLTIDAIARHAESMTPHKPIYGYRADGSFAETTWGATIGRARWLAAGLEQLGIRRGELVATLAWNTVEHLEAYFAVPMMGAALHTLNTRLHVEDTARILEDAGTAILIVAADLVDVADELRERVRLHHVIVIGDDVPSWALRYEDVVNSGSRLRFAEPTPELDEREVCSLCYTTGTTGHPKGVAYSHRALAIQSLVLMASDFEGLREEDVVLVVVPMFHANAWGHPYAAALAGASLVLPHRDLSAESLLTLIHRHGVTHTGGVATVWAEVLQVLDRDPARFDTSSLRVLRFGGAKAPVSLLRGFEERHGIHVVHGWGMTEMSPMGAMAVPTKDLRGASAEVRWKTRAKQGRPIPFLRLRLRAEDGSLAPWDGATPGEVEARGPSVIGSYLNGRGADSFTDDGWLRTGDVGTIDPRGYLEIVDRAKDLIKSGGEWISSVALEQSLEEHPAVREAAVIAVSDARWGERPLAVVVVDEQIPVTASDLSRFLRGRHPAWWVPERIEISQQLPRTAAGKIRKVDLRSEFGVSGSSS